MEQREVIVLKIWHQYTFEEIGGLLEISPNTAAGRYRYGLQKLKTSLQGEDYERLESDGTSITFLETAQPLRKSLGPGYSRRDHRRVVESPSAFRRCGGPGSRR